MSNHQTHVVKNLVDQGASMAHVVKEKAVDAKDAVVDGALSIFGKATRVIRAHPIATIAVAGVLAVGAGFVVVRMIRR